MCEKCSPTRRQTLFGAAAVGAGVAGISQISDWLYLPKSKTAQLSGPPESAEVEVNIYTTESLGEISVANSVSKTHCAQIAKIASDYFLRTLNPSVEVSPNIKVIEEMVPDSVINRDDFSDTYERIGEYIHEETNPAKHSNLLLLGSNEVYEDIELQGKGRVPEWELVKPGRRHSVYLEAQNLLNFRIDKQESKIYKHPQKPLYEPNTENSVTVPVHEIGHNLGLNHLDGFATTDHDWVVENSPYHIPRQAFQNLDNPVFTTPMLIPYSDYAGKENNFGKKIVDVDPENHQVVRLPFFNPDIDLSHLYHTV